MTDNNFACLSFASFVINIIQESPVTTPQIFQNCNVLSTDAQGKFQWFKGDVPIPGATSPQLEVTEAAEYRVEILQQCQNVSSVPFQVSPISLENLRTANIFTPNGDEKNRTFTLPVELQNSKLQIYNRWGKLVYESSNYQNDWEGGNLPRGLYYYALSNPCLARSLQGWVEIVK